MVTIYHGHFQVQVNPSKLYLLKIPQLKKLFKMLGNPQELGRNHESRATIHCMLLQQQVLAKTDFNKANQELAQDQENKELRREVNRARQAYERARKITIYMREYAYEGQTS